MPSRFDIPDVSRAVDTLAVSEVCDAIEAYSVQLKQAIDQQNHSKRVSAGQVPVNLTRRNSAELSRKITRVRGKMGVKIA